MKAEYPKRVAYCAEAESLQHSLLSLPVLHSVAWDPVPKTGLKTGSIGAFWVAFWVPKSQNWKGQFWEYSMVKVRSFLQKVKKWTNLGLPHFLVKIRGFRVSCKWCPKISLSDDRFPTEVSRWSLTQPMPMMWRCGQRRRCWKPGRMLGTAWCFRDDEEKNMWGTWWSTEAFDGVMLSYWWKVEEIMMPISPTKMGISEWLLPNLQPKELGTFSPRWSVDGSQLVDTCNVSHRLGIHCVWPYTRVSWVKCPGYFPDMTNGLWVWSHWLPLAAIWLMNSGDTP